jgi:uncharacterized protein
VIDPAGVQNHATPEPTQPTAIPFERVAAALCEALDSRALGRIDTVVAIARGGVVAGALAAYHLRVPLRLLRLRFRDDAHAPLSERPVLASDVPNVRGQRVLVVDDVSVSGAALRAAREVLDTTVVTLVVKGRTGVADVVLIDDVPECVRWPWNEDVAGT